MPSYQRKKIFEEELEKLCKKNHITMEHSMEMKQIYAQYYEEEKVAENNRRQKIRETKMTEIKKKEVKPKKVLSEREIKERNITWTLILGVILLLIGGIVFATNNWEEMKALTKTMYVGFISILFYGMSFFSGRVFKIKKTSFAFLVLGSLFLPIIVITAGYFELFGNWFSLRGKGKYLFGLMGSLLCLPIYFTLAKSTASRLFVWFTYINATLLIGFMLAFIQLSVDAFYLGIALYNLGLLLFYHFNKSNKKMELFTRELPVFAQTNLIISTLLMLIFFANEVIYSINVIVTSILYLSMVFISKKKEYSFVFSALIIYGMYQLIENTFLQTLDYIFISLIGYVFIALSSKYKNEEFLKKSFHYTGAMVSFFAFIYISVEGIFIRLENSSFLLFFAYLFISINYIYLTYQTKKKTFSYLASMFLFLSGFQSYKLIENLTGYDHIAFYMFVVAGVVYAGLFIFNKSVYTVDIKTSAFYLANATMSLSLLVGTSEEQWIDVVMMFLSFSGINYCTFRIHPKKYIQTMAKWFASISLFFSLYFIYPKMIAESTWYQMNLGYSFHLVVSSVILLFVSFFIRKKAEETLAQALVWVSAVIYLFGLLSSLDRPFDEIAIRPFLFLGAVIFFTVINRLVNITFLWITVSLSLLIGSFLSISDIMEITTDYLSTLSYVLIAGVVLFIGKQFERKYQESKPYFFWTANLYLLLSFPVLIFLCSEHFLNFAAIIVLILYNLTVVQKNWQKYLFSYFGFISFTAIFLSIISNFTYEYTILDLLAKAVLFIVSMVIACLWYKANEEWKIRIKWFLVPYSLVASTLVASDLTLGLETIEIPLSLLYILFNLYILYKLNLLHIAFIPLQTLLYYIHMINVSVIENKLMELFLLFIVYTILKLTGERIFDFLLSFKHKKIIDWFSLYAFFTAFSMFSGYGYYLTEELVILQLIPSLLLVYWFYSQIKRVKTQTAGKIMTTIASFTAIIPYYQFISRMEIPTIIETEIDVLPWLVLTIGLSYKTWKNVPRIMSAFQWMILIITSWILIGDTLDSQGIMEPILLGVFALIFLLFGFQKRVKSFFFIGVFVLGLNVTLQTKPLWSAMPWWSYLLISGLILIGFASFHEWQKQQGEESLLKKEKIKWKEKFKNWK